MLCRVRVKILIVIINREYLHFVPSGTNEDLPFEFNCFMLNCTIPLFRMSVENSFYVHIRVSCAC